MSRLHPAVENSQVSIGSELPALERAFLIERSFGVSRTGFAESSWTRHVPSTKAVDGRLFILGGFCGVEKAYYPVTKELIANGVETVTIELPTYQRWHHQYHTEHSRHPERLLAQMARRVILDVNDKFGKERSHGAGHSTGGPAEAQAADFDTGLFDSITLWNPAGTGKKGVVRHSVRGPQVAFQAVKRLHLLRSNLNGHEKEIGKEYISYFGNAPRRGMEAVAVSRSDILPSLERVHRAGIHIGAILGWHDKFFPPEEVLPRLRTVMDDDRIIMLNTCHLGPLTHPKDTADAQLELLQAYGQATQRVDSSKAA